MLAYRIKEAVCRYFTKKRMAVTFELGLCRRGRLRADVFALSMSGRVTITEVKSGVADFRSDSKWSKYLEYAESFYFAFDRPTYEKLKSEVPKGVGVLVVDEIVSATRTRLKVSVVQRTKSRIVDEDIKRELLIRIAFRNSDFTRYKRK